MERGKIMRDDNCIFCKIANGEIPSATLYEDDSFKSNLSGEKDDYKDDGCTWM